MATFVANPQVQKELKLTDEQKTQFASLRGPKFEIDLSQAFQGGGRVRRGGNNNNN